MRIFPLMLKLKSRFFGKFHFIKYVAILYYHFQTLNSKGAYQTVYIGRSVGLLFAYCLNMFFHISLVLLWHLKQFLLLLLTICHL